MKDPPRIPFIEGDPDRIGNRFAYTFERREGIAPSGSGLQNEARHQDDGGSDEDGEGSSHDERGETANRRGAPGAPPPARLLLEETDQGYAARPNGSSIDGLCFVKSSPPFSVTKKQSSRRTPNSP